MAKLNPMSNFTVTLESLRKAGACFRGYNKVVRAVQSREFSNDDRVRATYIRFAYKEPIPLLLIVESNGIDDAIWALRCVNNCDRDVRLFAVWCARKVQHLMTDARSVAALDVAENFANGRASKDELIAARAAAWDAARAVAWNAARAAARSAAWDAAWDAARSAAWDAARAAAWDAARAAQKQMFIAMCNGTAPWQGDSK